MIINNADLLDGIKSIHLRIEIILQQFASKISMTECSKCTDICCREIFCRESVESTFLRFIMGEQINLYNETDGWLHRQSGCTISFGRPLICYEYFCFRFKGNPSVNKLKSYGSRLKKIYSKTYRNQHILVIQDLNSISRYRLEKILNDLKDMEQNTIKSFEITLS